MIEKKCDGKAIITRLTGLHFEHLLLHGFPQDNVRGLIDIADRITSYVATGTKPKTAIANVFAEVLGKKRSFFGRPSKKTEPHRMTIESKLSS